MLSKEQYQRWKTYNKGDLTEREKKLVDEAATKYEGNTGVTHKIHPQTRRTDIYRQKARAELNKPLKTKIKEKLKGIFIESEDDYVNRKAGEYKAKDAYATAYTKAKVNAVRQKASKQAYQDAKRGSIFSLGNVVSDTNKELKNISGGALDWNMGGPRTKTKKRSKPRSFREEYFL